MIVYNPSAHPRAVQVSVPVVGTDYVVVNVIDNGISYQVKETRLSLIYSWGWNWNYLFHEKLTDLRYVAIGQFWWIWGRMGRALHQSGRHLSTSTWIFMIMHHIMGWCFNFEKFWLRPGMLFIIKRFCHRLYQYQMWPRPYLSAMVAKPRGTWSSLLNFHPWDSLPTKSHQAVVS